MSYSIKHVENLPSEIEEVLFHGLLHEAKLVKDMSPMQGFGIYIENDQGNILGGAKGVTLYGALYVDILWIHESLRHQGLGTQLMKEAEKIGKERSCSFATVNTMDWEGLAFYQKLGYQIEFIREGFEKESKMYLLRKKL